MTKPSPRRIVFGLTASITVNAFLAPALPYLLDDGWDVHIACSPGDVNLSGLEAHVNLHFIPMKRAISPVADGVALGRWVRLLSGLEPAAVVGGTPKAALLSVGAARLTGVPVRVFQVRGARWDGMIGRRARLLKTADRVTARSATTTLAVSDSLADLFVAEAIGKERPVVLGAGGSKGVDTQRFTPPTQRTHPPTLGFVGRLSQGKGIEDVLHVYDACRREVPEARLIIVGDVDPADAIPSTTVERLNAPSIMWERFTHQPEELMREMDVLVFPSRREGMPNVVLEAAGCGVPAVGYNVTGTRDAIVDGETGFLVELGDTDQLAARSLTLLQNPSRHGSMARAARLRVVECFDSARVCRAFAEWLGDQTDMNAGQRQ